MIRDVHLHGRLGTKFGRVHALDVSSPAEAFQALGYQLPGFRDYVSKRRYVVSVGRGTVLDQEQLDLRLGSGRDIHLTPAGLVTGIETILLTGILLFTAVAAVAVLAMPGVPTPGSREETTRTDSFIFDGPINNSEQGHPVPLIYGRMRVGSVVGSTGITTTDVTEAGVSTDPSNPGGGGGYGGYVGSTPGFRDSESGSEWNLAKGGKGGGGAGQTRSAQEDPNSLQSQATAKILDIIGEGEIVGLVNGLRSVYFDGTPLQNLDGSFNFAGVAVEQRTGLPDQDFMPGFAQTENTVQVDTEVAVNPGPVTRSVLDPAATVARVTVRIPQLYRQDTTNGDLKTTSVAVKVLVQADGGGFTEVTTMVFNGKTTSGYQRSVDVRLPNGTQRDIRLVRETPDSDVASLLNETRWDLLTSVVEAKLSYPDTAMVGVTVDARQFGSNVPARGYEVKGLIIDVPTNYDPETRAYAGVWDGTFKRAWTDNPAWVFRDLVANRRYGLGNRVPLAALNKWALYSIAQYNDELVPDGFGGEQPRYTLNCCINTQADAREVLASVASNFRGWAYLSAGTITAAQDRPEDPSVIVTPANVSRSEPISYSRVTSADQRRSVAVVYWNDPEDSYRLTPELYEVPDLVRRFGRKTGNEVTAFGVTNRGQANRMARWIMEDEAQGSNSVVTYGVGEDHAFVEPGRIAVLHDPMFTAERRGGRVRASAANQVTLDKPVTLAQGVAYLLRVTLPDGTTRVRNVTNVAGVADVITLAGNAFSANPLPGAVWTVESAQVANRQFRVRAIEQDEPPYRVRAVLHDPTKYERVELGRDISTPGFMDLPSGPLERPSGLDIKEFLLPLGTAAEPAVQFSWNSATDPRVAIYQVQYQPPEAANWTALADNLDTSRDVRGATPGTWSFRVRALDVLGNKTAWTQYSEYLGAQQSGLPNVTQLALAVDDTTLQVALVWTNPVDTRPLRTEVLFGPDYGTAENLGIVDAQEYTVSQLGRYWVRTTFMGAVSAGPPSVLVEAEDAPRPAWDVIQDRPETVNDLDPAYVLSVNNILQGLSTSQGQVDAAVAALDQALGDLDGAVDGLTSDLNLAVANFNLGLGSLDVDLSNLEQAVDALIPVVTDPATGLVYRVGQAEGSIANGLQRVAALEVSVDTPTTGLLGRTGSLETATANLQTGKADASRVTLVEARASSLETENSNRIYGIQQLEARASSLETATANLLTGKADASRVTLLEAKALTLPNLLRNGDFSEGKAGWIAEQGGTWNVFNDARIGSYANLQADCPYITSVTQPCEPGDQFSLSADGEAQDGVVYVQYLPSYTGGVAFALTPRDWATRHFQNAQDLPGGGVAPAGTTGFRVVIARNSGPYTNASRIKVNTGGKAAGWSQEATQLSVGSRVGSAETAVANLQTGKADASRVTLVEANVTSLFNENTARYNEGVALGARTGSLETATANLQTGKADASRVATVEATATGLANFVNQQNDARYAEVLSLQGRTGTLETATSNLQTGKADASRVAVVEALARTIPNMIINSNGAAGKKGWEGSSASWLAQVDAHVGSYFHNDTPGGPYFLIGNLTPAYPNQTYTGSFEGSTDNANESSFYFSEYDTNGVYIPERDGRGQTNFSGVSWFNPKTTPTFTTGPNTGFVKPVALKGANTGFCQISRMLLVLGNSPVRWNEEPSARQANARTTSLETATANLQTGKADASRVTTVEANVTTLSQENGARYNETQSLSSRTGSLETATANLQTGKADASRVTTVEATATALANTVNANNNARYGEVVALQGRASSLETATANLQTGKADASRVTLLEASALTLPNLLRNGDFVEGKAGWTAEAGGTWNVLLDDRIGAYASLQADCPYIVSDPQACQAGDRFSLSCDGESESGNVYIQFLPVYTGGVAVTLQPRDWATRHRGNAADHPSGGYAPAGATQFRVVINRAGSPYANAARIKVNFGATAAGWSQERTQFGVTARLAVNEVATANLQLGKAEASRVTQLEVNAATSLGVNAFPNSEFTQLGGSGSVLFGTNPKPLAKGLKDGWNGPTSVQMYRGTNVDLGNKYYGQMNVDFSIRNAISAAGIIFDTNTQDILSVGGGWPYLTQCAAGQRVFVRGLVAGHRVNMCPIVIFYGVAPNGQIAYASEVPVGLTTAQQAAANNYGGLNGDPSSFYEQSGVVVVPGGAYQNGVTRITHCGLNWRCTTTGDTAYFPIAFVAKPMIAVVPPGVTYLPYSAGPTDPGLFARVETAEGAVLDLYGRTYARWTIGAAVPGAAAFIEARAETSPGTAPTSSVAIGAQQFAVFNPAGGGWKKALEVVGGNVVLSGGLQAGAFIRLGNGQGWPVALRPVDFNAADGQAVSFGTDLGGLPNLTFAMNGLDPLGAGETYDVRATGLSATGFTLYAKINVPGTPSNFNRTASSGSSAFGSGGLLIDKSADPNSTDGTYRIVAGGTNRHAFRGLGFGAVSGVDDYDYVTGEMQVWALKGGTWQFMASIYTYSVVDRKEYPAGIQTAPGYWDIDETVSLGDGVTAVGVRHAEPNTHAGMSAFSNLIWTAPGTASGVRSATASGQSTRITVRPQ